MWTACLGVTNNASLQGAEEKSVGEHSSWVSTRLRSIDGDLPCSPLVGRAVRGLTMAHLSLVLVFSTTPPP